MLAFLRDANTSQSVLEIFDELQARIGIERFKQIFPLILTDNGSEFSNPVAIECDRETGEIRTRIFYCDAGKPYQKGAIEIAFIWSRALYCLWHGRTDNFWNYTFLLRA